MSTIDLHISVCLSRTSAVKTDECRPALRPDTRSGSFGGSGPSISFSTGLGSVPILDEPACISSLKIKSNHEIICAITL